MPAGPKEGDTVRRDQLLTAAGALFESFSYDRSETIERFLRIARGIAPFDSFALILRRAEGGVEVIASADVALPEGADAGALRIEDFQPSVGEETLRFVVDEIDAEATNPLFRTGGAFRSTITIPLAAPAALVGLLILAAHRPRAFSDRDLELYFTVGSQLAVALENIRFHREARQQVEVLTTLHASEIALSLISDVAEAEERIVRTAVDVLQVPFAAVFRLVEGGRLEAGAAHPAGGEEWPSGPVPVAPVEVQTLVAERRVLEWAEGALPVPAIRPREARALLALPLAQEGRTTAVLVIAARHRDAFHPARRPLAEIFAAHAASVLANAHLYARLGSKADELERSNLLIQQYSDTLRETNVMLERRLYELSTLYEVVSQASTARDLDAVLRFILDKACVVMSAEKGSLFLIEGDRLRPKVSRGIEMPENLEFALGEGVAGWVALHGSAKIVEDTMREPRFARRGAPTARPETMLCVPLKAGEKVIGVLNVDRDLRYGAFTAEESRLLTTLASAAEGTIQRILLFEDLAAIVDEILEGFATAVEARDKYTYGHSKRVRQIALAIAKRLRLADEEVETIGRAALLHDVGKIGIPNEILLKTGPLTAPEYEAMKEHVVFGERIINRIRRMSEVARIVRHHHEFWDGSGYPDGLAGDRIPIGSAIIAVADAYDTIVTDRPYRAARSRVEAVEELRRCGARQFHPLVVGAFLTIADRTFNTETGVDDEEKPAAPVPGPSPAAAPAPGSHRAVAEGGEARAPGLKAVS